MGAFALSEDQIEYAARAEADGDGWRLSGEKFWISNAPDADVDNRVRPHVRRGGAGLRGRDVRAPRIDEGASEVQRTIIAREILKGRTSR